MPPGGSAWPLVLALASGLLVWIGTSAVYVSYRGLRPAGAASPVTQPASHEVSDIAVPPTPATQGGSLAGLPPGDVAFLATVPHLAAFFAVITFDLAVYGGHLTGLGFGLRQLPRGLVQGFASGAAFVPLVFGGAVLTEWVYRAIQYSHPGAHDLLHVLGRSTDPLIRLAIVAGATVVAPLAEELLFRGHLQTIARRAVMRASPAVANPSSSASWGAILVASVMFTAVHPVWTWPPIFLLSLCLGWLYERTGNLWAPVALHAAFNAVSTLIFLTWGG